MDGVLRGRRAEAPDLRAAQEATARALEAFLAPGYGPHGGAKLVDGDPPHWMRSPALALGELQGTPDLAPFQDLAARVQRHAGDGATTAVLLAARLVRLALASPAGAQAFVQGYPLARRQALAALAAQAAPTTPAQALAAASPGGIAWSQAVVDGLVAHTAAGAAGTLDLDAIEVVAEPEPRAPRGDAATQEAHATPAWLDGVPIDPQWPARGTRPAPRAATDQTDAHMTRVLLLAATWRVTPRTAAAWRMTGTRFAPGAAEDALRRRAAARVRDLGVGLVACAGSLDEGLAGLLQDGGCAVATDVPLSRLRRLAAATGARVVPRPEEATADDVGPATLVRRPHRIGGWLVRGAGPARTLVLPAGNALARAAAVEAGERLLRAAGLVLADPRAVPGAGAWQRAVADSLRRAADAAPRRTPFALHAAADAIAALDADLRANAAGQPLDAATRDAYACVRLAVASAFDCAHQVLRLDARLDKRPSTPGGLRGGLGKAGSPKGIPGDLPPLM